MKIAGITSDSIVDGPGIRLSVFTQGCPHHCKGCHNPETWTFDGGKEISPEDIIKLYDGNPLLDGVTFSGGEPFMPERYSELATIAKHVKQKGGNVWVYTGFTLEELMEKEKNNSSFNELLKNIDVVVDGPFILDKRSLALEFRGSTNQRILHLTNGEIGKES